MSRSHRSRGLRVIAWIVAPVAALVVLWCALAIRFAAPFSPEVDFAIAVAFALLGLLGVVGLLWTPLRRATYAATLAIVVFAGWWSTLQPSNDREWQPDVARLPHAEIDGDLVTIRNIRDFEYRSETDFTPRWYDKTFDLRKLDRGDLIGSYWMGDAIAHMFVSFGFGDDHLAISIETRKEVGESYSTLAGFFRQYELFYVVADERDLIGVRTNYRENPPEDVYVYRTQATPEQLRRLFLDYVREINALYEQAAFYNTATTNCTTNIWMHTKVNGGLPFSWKILLSGYVPEFAWENGRIVGEGPFSEVRRRARVNDAARAGGVGPGFSQRIRANLP
jgi:hypothetical protein